MIITARGFSNFIQKNTLINFDSIIKVILWIFIVNALLGLTGMKIFTNASEKPVGVFAEPSHLAITLSPIFIYYCILKLPRYYFLIIFLFIWAILIKNLTTIILLMAGFLTTIQNKKDFKKAIILTILFILTFYFYNSDYFKSRLIFSSQTDNISVLAILQGWDIAIQMLHQTSFWGAGFQQFGIMGVSSDILTRTTLLANRELNILDGGTTAAKIVGEFGFFGIYFLLFYLFICYKILKTLFSMDKYLINRSYIFFSSCVISYSFEVFLWGVGYFSPSGFLFLVGLLGLYYDNFLNIKKGNYEPNFET